MTDRSDHPMHTRHAPSAAAVLISAPTVIVAIIARFLCRLELRAGLKIPTLVAAMVIVSGCIAASETTIPVQSPDLVASGGQLYAANCAECHGADLRGTEEGPSHLSEVYEPSHHADGAFFFAVQNGSRAHHWSFGRMPPIEGLSPEDVEAIVAFVREHQRIEGFEPYPP